MTFLLRVAALCVALILPLSASATLVRMQTSLGVIDIELFDDQAPLTVANFLAYVRSGAYTQSFIHRSVPGFVIQGGGFGLNNQGMVQIPTLAPIINELSTEHSNLRGTIAMAKADGNPDSATSQWFINLTDNSLTLDRNNGGYTVFGRVIGDGMSVVDAIAALRIVQVPPLNELPIVSDNGNGNYTVVVLRSVSVLPTGPLVTDFDRVFNYLEGAFLRYIAPASQPTQGLSEFKFRYYPGTGAAVISDSDTLWYLGPASKGQLYKLGRLAEWLDKAAAAGY